MRHWCSAESSASHVGPFSENINLMLLNKYRTIHPQKYPIKLFWEKNAFWKAIKREAQMQPILLTCFWLPSPQRMAPRSVFAMLPFAFRLDSVQELDGFLQVLGGCTKLIQHKHHLSQVGKKGVIPGVWLQQVNIPGHVHTTQGFPHFYETSSHKKLVFTH